MALQLVDGEDPMPDATTVDGRVLRGERNRDAIVDALLALLAEGDPQPSARNIAQRAGVSLRTVFQHFNDIDTLYGAVAQRQVDRLWSKLDPLPAPEAPLDVRIDAVVSQRVGLFETIAPVRRAAVVVNSSSPALQRGLARSEAFLRRQIAEIFAAELAGDPDRIAAADFAASWEAWEGLRRSSRRSVATATRVMRVLLLAVLEPT
jgi:TetR/AcrR family transcriptional regulator of autoinduction and epiphytic fitness